jgi:hypothetical protein
MKAGESRGSDTPPKGIDEIAFANHATFSDDRKLANPLPRAGLTRLSVNFHPHDLEKTQEKKH